MTWAIASLAIQKRVSADKKGVVYSMTVLEVGPPDKNVTYINVIFRVSQRVYKLPTDANPEYLRLLKESEKYHTAVLVRRVKEESDVIVSVERPKQP